MAYMERPLATSDQIEIERRALALQTRADVQAAIDSLKDRWLDAFEADADHRERFDAEFEQAVFCGLMNAANHDPLYPRIHAFGRTAHSLDGQHVPGTRSGHPNPDYIYRFMIVDEAGSYQIEGSIPPQGLAGLEIALLTREQVYLKNISLHQLSIRPDGSFTLTIDALPDQERDNHLCSAGGGYQLLIRDIIADPVRQRPASLTGHRLGPIPARREYSLDDMARTCEFHINKHAQDLIVGARNLATLQANQFPSPKVHSEAAYSAAQAYSGGRFLLGEDEAILFTIERGNAAFASVPVSNFWGGIGPFVECPVSMGTGTALPQPDGWFLFVMSHQDPGVYNWISPAGLHEGAVLVRWVGFDASRMDAPPPSLATRLVKLEDLEDALPADVPRTTREGRVAQLKQRSAAYMFLLG